MNPLSLNVQLVSYLFNYSSIETLRQWSTLSNNVTPEKEIKFLAPQTIFLFSTRMIIKYWEMKEFHWWLGGTEVSPRVGVTPTAPAPRKFWCQSKKLWYKISNPNSHQLHRCFDKMNSLTRWRVWRSSAPVGDLAYLWTIL